MSRTSCCLDPFLCWLAAYANRTLPMMQQGRRRRQTARQIATDCGTLYWPRCIRFLCRCEMAHFRTPNPAETCRVIQSHRMCVPGQKGRCNCGNCSDLSPEAAFRLRQAALPLSEFFSLILPDFHSQITPNHRHSRWGISEGLRSITEEEKKV